MSSTNTSATLPLLKFWVLNFSIRFFFFSCTGTFVHFIYFHFFCFPFKVFWFTKYKFVLVLRTNFFFKAQTSCWPNLEFWLISIKTPRNSWNRSEWPEIFSEVEYGGLLFWFVYRHGIFWSLQPEQNRINNIELNLIT